MAQLAKQAGAVFVGPQHGSQSATVQHDQFGLGIVETVSDTCVVVDHAGAYIRYAATWANQKPKLIMTGSEQGKTCLANILVKGMFVTNKDDDKYVGTVMKIHATSVWGYAHNGPGKHVETGYATKHQAIKALVEHHNKLAENFNTMNQQLKWSHTPAPHQESLKSVALSFEEMYLSSPELAVKQTKPPTVPPEAEPDAGTATTPPPPIAAKQPHASDAWKTHKVELSGGDLYGANPVKNSSGQIVAGEIVHSGIVVGYTSSNGDGTMKVFHADGTLVAPAAIPGKHVATDTVAAHHTKFYSGALEKMAEIQEKVAKILVKGEKITPSELSLEPGGLHCEPHISYAKPHEDGINHHFSDTVTTERGTQVYDLVPGAHLLNLSTTQLQALKSYTASGYESMNNELRAGTVSSTVVANRIAKLDSIYLQTPELEESIEVFRGIDKFTAEQLLGVPGTRVGQTFVEAGFSSCSAYVSSAFTAGSNIIMRITVPRGSHVIKPSMAGHFGDKEREILLPRDAKFLVVRDEMVTKASGSLKRQVDLVFTGSRVN